REWKCKNPIEATIASQASTHDLPSGLKKEMGKWRGRFYVFAAEAKAMNEEW
ncbi:7567_t:CDS:2, partial [Racocetra persica]